MCVKREFGIGFATFSLAYPYEDRLIKSVSTLSLLQNVQQMFVFG